MTLMKANLKTVLLFCLLTTLPSATYGQSSSDDVLSQKADEAINALRVQMKIPGTSVAVVRDGRIIKATGYGLANVELNVPVTPDTIFQAGSTGKQFLATAILLLAEEGKLSLDDSITKYFSEAPESCFCNLRSTLSARTVSADLRNLSNTAASPPPIYAECLTEANRNSCFSFAVGETSPFHQLLARQICPPHCDSKLGETRQLHFLQVDH